MADLESRQQQAAKRWKARQHHGAAGQGADRLTHAPTPSRLTRGLRTTWNSKMSTDTSRWKSRTEREIGPGAGSTPGPPAAITRLPFVREPQCRRWRHREASASRDTPWSVGADGRNERPHRALFRSKPRSWPEVADRSASPWVQAMAAARCSRAYASRAPAGWLRSRPAVLTLILTVTS